MDPATTTILVIGGIIALVALMKGGASGIIQTGTGIGKLIGGAGEAIGEGGEYIGGKLGDLPENMAAYYDHLTTPLPKDVIDLPASERVITELWEKVWRDRGGAALSNVPYLTAQEYGMLNLTYNAYIYNSAMTGTETLSFNTAARAHDMLEHHKGVFA